MKVAMYILAGLVVAGTGLFFWQVWKLIKASHHVFLGLETGDPEIIQAQLDKLNQIYPVSKTPLSMEVITDIYTFCDSPQEFNKELMNHLKFIQTRPKTPEIESIEIRIEHTQEQYYTGLN